MKNKKISLFLLILLITIFAFSDNVFAMTSSIPENTSLLSILLLIAAVVLFIVEMFLPTFGIAGILSLLSFIAFFYLNLTIGNAEILHIVIFLIGCILLGLEIFVPSFGIIGIAGLSFIILGIFLAVGDIFTGILTLSIAVIISTIFLYVFIKHGYKHRLFEPIILKVSKPEKDPDQQIERRAVVGEKGIAESALRPSGVMNIGERRIDVVTQGEFIEKGENIIIVSVNGNVIKVRRY